NVEDPLSEELLKGEFQGKDTITVKTKKVGGKTQLIFDSSVTEEPKDPPTVGAAAGGDEDASGKGG
ncbi:MAG: hypothetical protein JXM70_17145, partial [Pirellulales bacterium]|nr:hypothetical protein [Pirellulales bacterium]